MSAMQDKKEITAAIAKVAAAESSKGFERFMQTTDAVAKMRWSSLTESCS
jgi:hypothetical protein